MHVDKSYFINNINARSKTKQEALHQQTALNKARFICQSIKYADNKDDTINFNFLRINAFFHKKLAKNNSFSMLCTLVNVHSD